VTWQCPIPVWFGARMVLKGVDSLPTCQNSKPGLILGFDPWIPAAIVDVEVSMLGVFFLEAGSRFLLVLTLVMDETVLDIRETKSDSRVVMYVVTGGSVTELNLIQQCSGEEGSLKQTPGR
jgi:hypothetical protein